MGLGFLNFERKLRGEEALVTREMYPKPVGIVQRSFRVLLETDWYEGEDVYEQEIGRDEVEWAWDSFNWEQAFGNDESLTDAMILFLDGEAALQGYFVDMVDYWRQQPWAREYLE